MSVQLVSALILRLVQTSAQTTISKDSAVKDRALPVSDEELPLEARKGREGSSSEESESGPKSGYDDALQQLSKTASPLSDSAGKSAQYVVRFFVSRAMTAPKTGDQPHRHLLDIFCEDLISVLGQPEWPAAELLLRALLVHMVEIAEKPKFTAPAKNMALELLGLMGSAISDLVANTRHLARGVENDESEFSAYLRQMLDEYMEGALESGELLGWQGPYRAVVEHLQPHESDDSQVKSAQSYYLVQWGKAVAGGGLPAGPKSEKLAVQLCHSLSSSEWVTSE